MIIMLGEVKDMILCDKDGNEGIYTGTVEKRGKKSMVPSGSGQMNYSNKNHGFIAL